MEKIRILFYTDRYHSENPAQDFTLEPAGDLSLSMLRDLIVANKPTTADIEVGLVNRNMGSHAEKKLTSDLLKEYDELWVFGHYQADYHPSAAVFDSRYGGPYNELDDSEVAALEAWMKTGGVLITGDHSEEKQNGHDTTLPSFLGLGRALGHRIPRAGRMRVWDGSPLSFREDSFNTNSAGEFVDLLNSDLEKDQEPQHIYVYTDEQDPYYPHELFLGRRLQGGPLRRIQVFPDHPHEGKLATDFSDWPAGYPLPRAVAWGFDHRFNSPRYYPIVSVYEGSDGLGRIVADSTWHHYINKNLKGLPADSVLGLIGNYYGNLAYWLAPRDKRERMQTALLPWLALNPRVAEVASGDAMLIGQTAKQLIDSHLRAYEIVALSDYLTPPTFLKLPKKFISLAQEVRLGHCLKQFYEKDLPGKANGLNQRDLITYQDLLSDGLKEALQASLRDFENYAKTIGEGFQALIDIAEPDGNSDRLNREMDEPFSTKTIKEDTTVSQFQGDWEARLEPNTGGPSFIQFDIRDGSGTDVDIYYPPMVGGSRPAPVVGKTHKNHISFTLNISGREHNFYGAYRAPVAGDSKDGYLDGVFVYALSTPLQAGINAVLPLDSDDGGWTGSQPRNV
jgi:hypothetical protein